MDTATTRKPALNKEGEEMLWQDWTGEIHQYLYHIRTGIWALVILEVAKFVLW